MGITLQELADRVGARLVGDPKKLLSGVGTLTHATTTQITFLSNPRYRKHLEGTGAGAVILTESDLSYCPVDALVSSDPYLTYARVAAFFVPDTRDNDGIHSSAVIGAGANVDPTATVGPHAVIGANVTVGAGAIIGPGCVVQRDVVIGAQTRLVANVMVYYGCRIGCRVLIHAGAVIGSDGFGFANDKGIWIKIAQLGRVIIGDDVEIGANTTIDRGAVEDTVIEDGVILDNLIQVAHNVRIGAHTAMAGCVGVAGSAVIGKHCAIGGGAGILGHLEIADGVTVTAMSLVTKSIRERGVYSSGTPLQPSDSWHKSAVRFKQLDEMARRLKQIEKELADLKKKG